MEWRKPKLSPVDLIVPRKAAGSKFRLRASCGVEKTQVVPCGLDCSKKSSRVKVPTTASTLSLLVITFRVMSMRIFVEEGISDMETTLLALGDCSKGLQLVQTIWVQGSQLSYPKFLPSASATIHNTLGFVWMRFNTLNRHNSDIVDSLAWGYKVFCNQGGLIRFLIA